MFFSNGVSELVHEDKLLSAGVGAKQVSESAEHRFEQLNGARAAVRAQQAARTRDALIADVYQNVPQSGPFIRYCQEEGKTLMSQLTDTDFDNAAMLEGLGVVSALYLKRVYIKFQRFAAPASGRPLGRSGRKVSWIDDLPLSSRAKNCLRLSDISSLEELLAMDESDLLRIRNLGKKILEEIRALSSSGPALKSTAGPQGDH